MKKGEKNIIYFAGIGGIGMSALARWYNQAGYSVSGYDRSRTKLTDKLKAEGIEIVYQDSIETIPEPVKASKEKTLVIYTPALPSSHVQMEFFRKQGYEIIKRSEALGRISAGHFTIAIAGAHGKTTTSTMVAHILKQAEKDFAAFLGGISANYNSNFLMQGKFSENTAIVAEADEFDKSFLKLSPDLAIITSADPDHLDIYGTPENVHQSYREFVHRIETGGQLIVNGDVPADVWKNAASNIIIKIYGAGKGAFSASNIRINQGSFIFDYNSPQTRIEQLQLNIPGFHNVENATAAITVALAIGIPEETIRQALLSFKGVKRRFEYIINSEKTVFIDDYAHHPSEIRALLTSVAALYPGKKITAIFQPHLYSRTRDFADGFAQSLDLAHEILLLEIYPAREEPIPGVSSQLILDKMTRENKKIVSREKLFEHMGNGDFDVVLTIGAGDIDLLVDSLKNILEKKKGGLA